MRIPLSWLGELVALEAGSDAARVHSRLVSVGFEEETSHGFDVSGPVVVGEVLSREPEKHSNGKTVNWCQVRVAPEGEKAADGGEDVRGIVCGAHNFEVGDRVIVTLPGAILPGNFVIAARKTYGHISDGMMASQRELGLGDEHAGIIVLRDLGLEAEVGTDAIEFLGLTDSAAEINVTPDRGYAFSIRGVAREYAHATGQAFSDPVEKLRARAKEAEAHGFTVECESAAELRERPAVTSFTVRCVRGIDRSRQTPFWMHRRLLLAGQRPIDLITDISNYVMLELGNPLHAYDLRTLPSTQLRVRRAADGELLRTLDGQERSLHHEDLVITDEQGKAIGLAGVMGGDSTKITDTTVDVAIEAACFDPVSIARSARRHKLPSEASKRFERGVDPLLAPAAAQRAVELLVTYGGGTADSLGCSVLNKKFAPHPSVEFSPCAISKLVGVAYTVEEIERALQMIGCAVTVREAEAGVLFTVQPPTWRSDLSRMEDFAEEVARLYGYDRIPSEIPVAPAGRGLTEQQRLRRKLAEHITAFGFTEVQNYPFITQKHLEQCGQLADLRLQPQPASTPTSAALKLVNPLDGAAPYMRTSLLPTLLECAKRNVSRGLNDLALVEFGRVFLSETENAQGYGTEILPPMAKLPDEKTLHELNESIPKQPLHAGGILLGKRVLAQPFQSAESYDWADAIEAVLSLARSIGVESKAQQATHPAYHPGRCAAITADGHILGVAGQLLPKLCKEFHLGQQVCAFEIDIDTLIETRPHTVPITTLSPYPAATQDLTLLVNVETPVSEIIDELADAAGSILENIRLIADYRGDGVPAGSRALTFALRFRSHEGTLVMQEANEAKMAAVERAQQTFGAIFRDAQ